MENEFEGSEMEVVVKRVATIVGSAFLIISVYFSYDGFDQQVTGGNDGYSTLAQVIGWALAIGFSVIQFILNSRYDQLNLTLKVMGIATYGYSIWTNFLGIQHILGMEAKMAIAVALALDIVPEPMIAWSFGDALKGDLIGNLSRWVLGTGGKKQKQQQHGQHQNNQNQHNQGKQKNRLAVQTRDSSRDSDDEESDAQPVRQRQMAFDGQRKPNGGGNYDRRVREDFKGKLPGKR